PCAARVRLRPVPPRPCTTLFRSASGSPALDMVLTLLVVTDEDTVADALEAAVGLSQEHPARILGVIRGPAEGEPRLDARIRVAQHRKSTRLHSSHVSISYAVLCL